MWAGLRRAPFLGLFAALILTGVGSYFLGTGLLDGPDSVGWWSHVPGLAFWTSVYLIVVLAIALVSTLVIWAIAFAIVSPLGWLLARRR